MRVKRLPLLGAGLLAVGAALWLEPEASAPRPEPVETAPTRAFDWPAGQAWRYALSLSSASSVQLMDMARKNRFESRLALEGQLLLRSYGRQGEVTRLGLRFAELKTHDFVLGGQPSLKDATQLEAHEAFLDLRPTGAVQALHFAATAPPVFRGMAQLVVGEMQARLRPGSTWTLTEVSQHGEAVTQYSATGPVLRKRREAYAKLSALSRPAARQEVVYSAELRVDGVLRGLEATEQIRAYDAAGVKILDSRSESRLQLLGVEAFDGAPPADAELTAYRQGQPAFDAKLARDQHRRQRIAGLTPDALLNTLAQHGPAGTVPDHNRFLWRASELLRAHPELCARLVELFARQEMTHRGRGLLLDLLVGAGTPEAQAALRKALATPAAQADPAYKRLYQRMALVNAPTAETIALLEQRHETPGLEGQRAATYALGSGAGHLHRRGQLERAEALGADLVDALGEAEDDFAVVSLVGALGNAGLPGHSELITRHRDHARPAVRHAVAAALRKLDEPATRHALVEMASDPVERVSRRALRSLMRARLDAPQLRRLRELVARRAVDAKCYPELVSLLTPYLSKSGEAPEILRLILDQRTRNPRLEGRIRALLGV